MDSLTMRCLEAEAAGMTYGKYIALLNAKGITGKKEKEAVPAKGFCKYCGGPIPETSNRRRYCSATCSDNAREKKKNSKK